MADRAVLSEHIVSSFIGRAGVVVEVGAVNRLLKELGDVLDVSGSDTVVGVRLCLSSVLSQSI
jgi:hypothetical protein